MEKDLNFRIAGALSLAAANYTGDTNGTVVDIRQAIAIMVHVNVGVVTTADATNYFTFKFESGADSAGGDFTEIDSTDYIDAKDQNNAAWDRKINATTEGPLGYQFGVRNSRGDLYGRVVADETLTADLYAAASVLVTKRHTVAAGV